MKFLTLLFLILISLVPALAASIEDNRNILREQVLKALDSQTSAKLYSIKPKYNPLKDDISYLDADRVLGGVDINEKSDKNVIQYFKDAIQIAVDKPEQFGPDNWCSPHHVLRLKAKGIIWDILPCYRAHALTIFKAGSESPVGYLNVSVDLKVKLDDFLLSKFIPVSGEDR